MKCILFFLTVSLSLPGYAKSWEALQKAADEQFLHKSEVETKEGEHPARTKEVQFAQPITKVELNRIDNPLFKASKAYTEYVFSLTKDVDFVEIFIYAGDETLNCYAAFENGRFRDLTRCSKE
jgi:hypothetical protein